MKKQLLYIFGLLIIFQLGLIKTNTAASFAWTGTTSSSWSVSGNWTGGGGGTPGSGDNITINSNAPNNLVLDQNRTVTNFTINGDTLDLGSYTLTTTGVTYFYSGLVKNGNLNISGSLCHFGGAKIDSRIEANCGYYHMNGGSFMKPTILVSTGSASTTGTGNCIFSDSLTITHSGNYYFSMGTSYGDIFQTFTITNHSSHEVYIGSSDSTFIEGNLILNNTSTGGIVTGVTGGVTYLASGKTISIGSSGFTDNYLTLKNFYQLGSTSQTLTLTGTAILNLINANFDGNLTVSSPGILLKNSTFNGTTSITRNGSSGNFHCDGGNNFIGAFSLDNAGSVGRVRFANTIPDNFFGDAIFNSTGGQDVQIAYSGNNVFSGNLTINSNKVVFNTASGKVTFFGANSQSLNGSYNYSFKKLAINKSANHVTANTTLSVDDTLFFVSGKLLTTSTNLLAMKAGSVASGASNGSFVSGPIKKTGNTSFQFPVGKNSVFRKVEITAPSNATDAFTAEYFDTTQVLGSNMDTTISFISDCGYWSLTRNTGSSNITPKFAFDSTHCDYLSVKPVHIAFWNGTKWVDKGEGVNDTNTKKTSAAVTSYGNFALAYKLMPGDAPQMPYPLTIGTTCTETELLIDKKDVWFSFVPDSAIVKIGLYNTDDQKLYAAIKQAVIFENYTAGDTLETIKDWQWDCDSALFYAQSFSTQLNVSSTYLMKVSKYDTGECAGIYDTTNYYLNVCILNLRTSPNTVVCLYGDATSLLGCLGNGSTTHPGSAIAGDIVAPLSSGLDIELNSLNGSGPWPTYIPALVVSEGVILTGDYDLLSEPASIATIPATGGYTGSTSPEGTQITYSQRGYDTGNVLDDKGYMFILRPGSTIRNLRIKGAMPGFQDYNEDNMLCAGVKLEKTNSLIGPYHILHCELFNFSYAGLFAGAGSDSVTMDHCFIHHVKGSGGSTTGKGYGSWLQGAISSSPTGTNFFIKNSMYDECKAAIDMKPNPANVLVDSCTLGQFIIGESINRHSFGSDYTHVATYSSCNYFNSSSPTCTPSDLSKDFTISGPGAGDFSIMNSIFYKKGMVITIPYPANPNASGNPVYHVDVRENTFSEIEAPPESFGPSGTDDCNYGGYFRLNDNYAPSCAWDWERNHGTDGLPAPGSSNNIPILQNAPNSFSYMPGGTVNSGSPQPPEVHFEYTSVAGYVPGPTTNAPAIPYINEGDNIEIACSHGSLGSQNVAYVVRPHPNNGTGSTFTVASDNHYDDEQVVTAPSSSAVNVVFGPGATHVFDTDKPGLYGIDVMAVDGSTHSRYYASPWLHKPIIVAPSTNHQLIFNIKDSYFAVLYGKPLQLTGVYKQVELNGHVIWREDIAEGGDGWEQVRIDLMGQYVDANNTSHDIADYFDAQTPTQTITFSISMPDPTTIHTNIVPNSGIYLRGLNVWVDDVYLKKFDNPGNLISDGDVEGATAGMSDDPQTNCIWYFKNITSFTGNNATCLTLDDSKDIPDVVAQTEAYLTSIDRKSGGRAFELKLPGIHYSSCTDYNHVISLETSPPDDGEVISVAVDFDYRDFLGCDDLTSNLTGTDLFERFPDEPYSDSNGDPIILTGGKYYIDRDITLSSNNTLNKPDNLIIEGCQIVVLTHNPPWNIIVEASAKLNIVPLFLGSGNLGNNSTRIFGCETMWGGIMNNGGIIDMFNMPNLINQTPPVNFTEIKDAIVAIESDGGKVEVRYVDFDNNYKSFLLYEDDDDFVGTPFIKGCNFTCSVGSLEKSPYPGWEPNEHIELLNIDNVTFTIGGVAGLRNNFSGAAYGIKSVNANLEIVNNHFNNMIHDDDQYYRRNDGTAIFATSSNGNTIEIYSGNEFENSPQAITTHGNMEIDINGNSFNNILRGINITNNASALNNIYNNTFTSVSTAVIGRNITGNFQVYDNTFTNSIPASITSMPYTSFNSTAVTLQNPKTFLTGLIRVFGNTIDDYRIGVHARNIQHLSIGSDLFTATYGTPNLITFFQTSFTENYRGIWLENCPEAQVQENTINQVSNATPSGNFTVEGITIAGVVKGLINLNVLNQLQVPIHIRDDCSDSELHCNELHNDVNPGFGVLLTSAVLPDQGSAASPWNNRWSGYNNTILFGVNADAPSPQFKWFYQTPGIDFNPHPAPGTAISQSTSSTGITCAVEVAPDDPDRDVRYADIVEDSLSFVDYVDEFTYKSKQYLFEQINADTSLLVRNTSRDTLFSEFYSDYKLSNIGLFLRVDSLILAGNLDAAYTLNSSITDTNQIETNQKTINGILVSKVLRDSVLNELDSTTLQEMAIQDPILGGKAVFMARAILFEEIHDVSPSLRMSSQTNQQLTPESPKSSFALLPNPATDRCEIHFVNMEHDFILEIRNSVGQLIYYIKIAAKTSSFEIALSKFSPGFYMVSVNDGIAIFDQKKLIIAK